MMINSILRKSKGSYKFTVSCSKRETPSCIWMILRYLPRMKKYIETPIQTIRICIQDIGIEFRIEKCDMLIMKKGRRETREGINLPNQESI